MRIGISIEKKRIASVLVNKNGMIANQWQSTYELDMHLALKDNMESLLMGVNKNYISNIFIATDFVRYLMKAQNRLKTVGVIRLAGHQPDILPPCFNWPEGLRLNVLKGYETLNGGYEYNGKPITELNPDEIIQATQTLIQKGAEIIVICGVFSPFYNYQEQLTASIIKQNFDIPVLCCHELEIVGFMERENAGILNGALRKEFKKKLNKIQNTLNELNLTCEIHYLQNNGSILSIDEALSFPLKTIDSAIMSAFIGASKLTQYQNAFIIDMDETSARAGIIKNGVPSHTLSHVSMDVNLDPSYLHSIPIGLNSPLQFEGNAITIHPACDVLPSPPPLTLKTAMLICNNQHAGDGSFDTYTAYKVIEKTEEMLLQLYYKLCNKWSKLPLILVGYASELFPQHQNIITPPFSEFAGAYGAATSNITYTISKTIQLTEHEKTLAELREQIMKIVVDRGGTAPKLTQFEVAPYRYLPGGWAHVTITASGEATGFNTGQLFPDVNLYPLGARLEYYANAHSALAS